MSPSQKTTLPSAALKPSVVHPPLLIHRPKLTLVPPNDRYSTQRNQRKLRHLHDKQVRPKLLADDGHDELVTERREEERKKSRGRAGDFASLKGRGVDVAEEEDVDGSGKIKGVRKRWREEARGEGTDLFHRRANWSHVVEFHLKAPGNSQGK